MVKAVEKASGRKVSGSGAQVSVQNITTSSLRLNSALFLQVSYKVAPRRDGDVASCYADPRLAETELAWKAEFDLERMCKDDNMGSSALHSVCFQQNQNRESKPQKPFTPFLIIVFCTSVGEDLWRWQSKNPTGFSSTTAS